MKQIARDIILQQRAQADDEKAFKAYLENFGGFDVVKLDIDNSQKRPDFQISKSDLRMLIEVKSHFGNDLTWKITKKLASEINKIKYPFDCYIKHKYKAMPSENEMNQLMKDIEEKLRVIFASPLPIEFPYPLWLGSEDDLNNYISEIEPFFTENNTPRVEWYDMMVSELFERKPAVKVILTLWGKNKLGHMVYVSTSGSIEPNTTLYYKDHVVNSKAKFIHYDPKIPRGIIFVKHGKLDSLYAPAVLPFGVFEGMSNFKDDWNSLIYRISPKIIDCGILTKDDNTWLSFYGYFNNHDENKPVLEIFRNGYAYNELPVDLFKFPSCSVYTFRNEGIPFQLKLIKDWYSQ
jgi:hypothetical protein